MQVSEQFNEEITLKELILKLVEWWKYLQSKWLIISIYGLFGGIIGISYAITTVPEYKSVMTFALEDDKQTSGALSGAIGLASSLGLELGNNAGGAFSSANLIELMKSRRMVQKTLLDSYDKQGKSRVLANDLLVITGLDKKLVYKSKKYLNISFPSNSEKQTLTLQQDSVLFLLYEELFEEEILSVYQKDKKVSIINVEVNSTNELFSKFFVENLVNNVSQFYIETKSKKSKNNVFILQHQADSIRNELNTAITGVAVTSDNTYNLNPAYNVGRVPSTKRQVDVQANTAILTQLVTNLELAKVTLLRETPLIQVIDRPILPLKKKEASKFLSLLVGVLSGMFLISIILSIKKVIKNFTL